VAQFVYTMNRVGKIVPPKREILKDISLSFFPGAKIGVLGLNGSGKSTLLRIMAGVDTDYNGEARPMADIKVGYLPQEPELDPNKDVRGNVEEGVQEAVDALAGLEQVYAEYAEPEADFDALAKKQARLEDVIQAWDAHNLDHTLEVAADALRLPAWDAQEFSGTVVAITHDRYFLDNAANWILELDRGHGIPYEGNYSVWLKLQRAKRRHCWHCWW